MPQRIIQTPTKNHFSGRSGQTPIAIVNHITAGPASACINWFQYPGSYASSHYLVCKNGDIHQFVDLKNGAWANGTQNVNPNKTMYAKKAKTPLVQKVGYDVNANMWTVSIEHENEWGGKLTKAQFESSAWLHAHIVKEVERIYGHQIPLDREHVLGHYEIDPVGKPSCPGANFPFNRLIKRANEILNKDKKPEPKPDPKPAENEIDHYRLQVRAQSDEEVVRIKEKAKRLGFKGPFSYRTVQLGAFKSERSAEKYKRRAEKLGIKDVEIIPIKK